LNPPNTVVVAADTQPVRIDAFLTAQGLAPSRAQAQRLLSAGLVTINGEPARASTKVKGGDAIEAQVPEPEPLEITAQNIPLEIIYEDAHIAVVNKPAGMVTHPAPGNWDATLVHALLYHLKDLSGIGGKERPGIVHRLDKDTSGLLIVAKDDISHGRLAAAFKAHDLERRYLALVAGHPKPGHGTIRLAIGRDRKDRKKVSTYPATPRDAITHYRTLEGFTGKPCGTSLLEVKLETGRTHQIRVHLAHKDWPVLGDSVYGGRKAKLVPVEVPRQMLHAARLYIDHPISGERLRFELPPPADFMTVMEKLKQMQPAPEPQPELFPEPDQKPSLEPPSESPTEPS